VTPQDLIAHGHWKRARAELEARLREQPTDGETLYLMAKVKLAFGDPDAALSLSRRASEAKPDNVEYRYEVSEAYGTLARHGGVFHRLRMARAFRREAEAVLAYDPRNPDALEALAEYYHEAPGFIGGDRAKARELVNRLIQLIPVRGYLLKALLATEESATDEAEAAHLSAVAAAPESYAAHAQLAAFSFLHRRIERVETEARIALRIAPDRAQAYTLLAEVYADEKRWADLEEILEAAQRSTPEDREPFYGAGRALLLSNTDLARAEAYFRLYLAQEPEGEAPSLAHGHWSLGLVLEKQGHRPEALEELRLAVRLGPDLGGAEKDLKRLQR
jgi:tetratricopeptide (TPR) repeat protein